MYNTRFHSLSGSRRISKIKNGKNGQWKSIVVTSLKDAIQKFKKAKLSVSSPYSLSKYQNWNWKLALDFSNKGIEKEQIMYYQKAWGYKCK